MSVEVELRDRASAPNKNLKNRGANTQKSPGSPLLNGQNYGATGVIQTELQLSDVDQYQVRRRAFIMQMWFKKIGFCIVISCLLGILIVLILYSLRSAEAASINVADYCATSDFNKCVKSLEDTIANDTTTLRRPSHFLATVAIFLFFLAIFKLLYQRLSRNIEKSLEDLPKSEIEIFSSYSQYRINDEVFERIVEYLDRVYRLKLLQANALKRETGPQRVDPNWSIMRVDNNNFLISHKLEVKQTISHICSKASAIRPDWDKLAWESLRDYMLRLLESIYVAQQNKSLTEFQHFVDPNPEVFNRYIDLCEEVKYANTVIDRNKCEELVDAASHILSVIDSIPTR